MLFRSVQDGRTQTRRVQHVRWEPAAGRVEHFFDDDLVCASVGVHPELVHGIEPFPTKDLAKGTVTIDPDGYPLLYHGSRDNMLRVIAFDGGAARELWAFDGRIPERRWNNDWDAAPLIINDTLIEGGENSWFFGFTDRKSTRLNSSHIPLSRMPSSA